MHLHNTFLVGDGVTSVIRLLLQTTKTVTGTLSWGVQDYPTRPGLHRWDYTHMELEAGRMRALNGC